MIFQRLTCNLKGKIRRRKYQGKMHVVVPVVMAGEGVLNGSNGPGFYPGKELEKSVISWNHKPIVLNHPAEGTADSIDVCEDSKMGFILNTAYLNKKLSAQAWLEEDRTNELAPNLIKNLEAGKTTEVSTGLYLNQEMTQGTHKKSGMKYDWIGVEHKPDHLAILLNEKGAFSVAMGGGLLQVNNSTLPSLNAMVVNAVKNIGGIITKNELSFSQKQCSLMDQLAQMLGEKGKSWYGYITDTYSNYLIFRDEKNELYKMAYSESGDNVSLTGKAVKVTRAVSYVTSNKETFVENRDRSLTKEPLMAKKFNATSFIEELVTNGGYEEKDREWLKELPEAALKNIKPVANAEPDEDDEEEAEVTPISNSKKKVLTEEEYINSAPASVRNSLKSMLKRDKREREELITKLIENTDGKLRKGFLEKQETEDLRGLLALNKSKKSKSSMFTENEEDDDEDEEMFDYAGAAGAATANRGKGSTESDTPGLMVPVMNMEEIAAERIKNNRVR